MPPEALKQFETIQYSNLYPRGAILFVEGQSPRGVFLLCTGRTKLSTCSNDGKTLMRIAEPGEILGLDSVITGNTYNATAETLDSSQVNFVRREDFLRFLKENGEACLRVARHLSHDIRTAYDQLRTLALSHSVEEKLANLLISWTASGSTRTPQGIRIKLTLTHEEIAQMIGASRETVTRLLGDFRRRGVIYLKGSTLLILDEHRLRSIGTP